MRKLITFVSICLTLSLLITSCGSVSITKRQHSRGYHISHNNMKHKKDVSNTENESTNLAQKDENIENTQKSISSPDNKKKAIKPLSIGKNNISEQVKPITKTDLTQKTNQSENTKETFINDSKSAPLIVNNVSSKIKDTVNNSKERISNARNESGLSLLWLIIVIVLILWLLGLLFGIGDFIHLLLVVALILLILWLLGII